eukprot:gene8050-10302_t
MIMAAEFGQLEVVKLLKEYGADVNSVSKRGMTPVMLAAVKGHTGIVEYLVTHRARLDLLNEGGETALTMACAGGKLEIAKYLIDHDGNQKVVKNNNKKGQSALMIAAERGHLPIVEYLAENDGVLFSADDEKDTSGSTALILAAMNGKLDVFIYLMERGADINYENQTGESALSALSKFYVNNEKRFDDFAARAAVKHELLEMMPALLPAFRTPNAILNTCFTKILYGLREVAVEKQHEI